MKRFFLISLTCVAGLSAKAQWTTNGTGDAVNNNPSGKVGIGIGTASPVANLQIGQGTGDGLLNLGGYTGVGSIRSSGELFTGTNVYAAYATSAENWLMRVLTTNTNGFSAVHFGTTGDINFFVKKGSVAAGDPISVTGSTYNVMKVTGTGKIGIGTITPGAQLTVALPTYSGTPVNSSLVYFNQSTNPAGSDLKPALELSNGGSTGFGLVSLATNNYFNGSVGIGTTSPQGYLHVNPTRPVIVKNNGGNGVYGSEIGFNAVLNTSVVPNQFRKLGGTSQEGGANIAVDYHGNMFFQMTDSPSEAENIINYAPQIAFLSNGSVGIGTVSPDAKLAVSGQVHAQEVKVSVTVPGPDYVFEKDYQLTSLEDIKTYIDQNKHLPEVPSAKEMEKNGVQLGEMNMLLLKKIEELTLYVIEQNKRTDDQNKRISILEDENRELKILFKK